MEWKDWLDAGLTGSGGCSCVYASAYISIHLEVAQAAISHYPSGSFQVVHLKRKGQENHMKTACYHLEAPWIWEQPMWLLLSDLSINSDALVCNSKIGFCRRLNKHLLLYFVFQVKVIQPTADERKQTGRKKGDREEELRTGRGEKQKTKQTSEIKEEMVGR